MTMFLLTLAAIYSMLLLIFAFIAKDIKHHGALFSGKIINQKDAERFTAVDTTYAESKRMVRNIISIIGSIIRIIITVLKMILMPILAALFITFLFSHS